VTTPPQWPGLHETPVSAVPYPGLPAPAPLARRPRESLAPVLLRVVAALTTLATLAWVVGVALNLWMFGRG
jgi:hypothetical protein